MRTFTSQFQITNIARQVYSGNKSTLVDVYPAPVDVSVPSAHEATLAIDHGAEPFSNLATAPVADFVNNEELATLQSAYLASFGGAWHRMYRGVYSFAPITLPSGAVVVGVKLRTQWAPSPIYDHYLSSLVVDKLPSSRTTPFVASDYGLVENSEQGLSRLPFLTAYANIINDIPLIVGGYDPTIITNYVLRTNWDFDNNEPPLQFDAVNISETAIVRNGVTPELIVSYSTLGGGLACYLRPTALLDGAVAIGQWGRAFDLILEPDASEVQIGDLITIVRTKDSVNMGLFKVRGIADHNRGGVTAYQKYQIERVEEKVS